MFFLVHCIIIVMYKHHSSFNFLVLTLLYEQSKIELLMELTECKNCVINSETTQTQNDASCVTQSFNLEWELAFV